MPQSRPTGPPRAKPPGWSPEKLFLDDLGRSHRGALGKQRPAKCINLLRECLALPDSNRSGNAPCPATVRSERAQTGRRREGRGSHYQMRQPADAAAARGLETVLEELKNDREMQRDLKALQNACCAVRLPRAIADAPRPSIVV